MRDSNSQKWRDLSIKDQIAIISAIFAFSLGWILTFAGFMVHPVGEVSNSVLFILGQALIYAASVFGIASYLSSQTSEMRHEMHTFLEKKMKHEEAMKRMEKEKKEQNEFEDE